MSTIQPSMWNVDPGLYEEVSHSIKALTIDPYKGALYYFFPFLGTLFAHWQHVYVYPGHEDLLPEEKTKGVLGRIHKLCQSAGLKRKLVVYTSLNHRYYSSGGAFSITSPSIFVPYQHLYLEKNARFTEKEVDFFLAREIAKVEESSSLVKTLFKILVLIAFFSLFATGLTLYARIAVFVSITALNIISERLEVQRADIRALEILEKAGEDKESVKKTAKSALEKLRDQNLFLREKSPFGKWIVTESGENRLELTSPSLRTRIKAISN